MTDAYCHLIQSAQQGCCQSIAQLIARYDAYIANVAKTFHTPPSIGLDDLIQEGRIAFMRALQRFRVDSRSSLIAFASVVIKRRIIDVLRRCKPTERLKTDVIDHRSSMLITIDIRDQFDTALEQMKPRHREAIEAFLAGEWTRDRYDALRVIQRILASDRRHYKLID